MLDFALDEARLALANDAEHGDPVEQFAPDIAGALHAHGSRLFEKIVDVRMPQEVLDAPRPFLIWRTRNASCGTFGPPISREKLPLASTATRRLRGHSLTAARTISPSA